MPSGYSLSSPGQIGPAAVAVAVAAVVAAVAMAAAATAAAVVAAVAVAVAVSVVAMSRRPVTAAEVIDPRCCSRRADGRADDEMMMMRC